MDNHNETFYHQKSWYDRWIIISHESGTLKMFTLDRDYVPVHRKTFVDPTYKPIRAQDGDLFDF